MSSFASFPQRVTQALQQKTLMVMRRSVTAGHCFSLCPENAFMCDYRIWTRGQFLIPPISIDKPGSRILIATTAKLDNLKSSFPHNHPQVTHVFVNGLACSKNIM